MRDLLKANSRWLRQACVMALLLFAGPACLLQTHGYGDPDKDNPKCENPPCKEDPPNPPDDPDDPTNPPAKFEPGTDATNAIMCDIPVPVAEGQSACATQAEADSGMALTAAGTALASGQSANFALDWSPAALAACGGLPIKKAFHGPFPDGLTVCLNCGSQIPMVYATPEKACVAKCKELINYSDGPFPPEGTTAFCVANARTATNYDKDQCYPDVCSTGGTPLPGWVDPRRAPEPVKWIDHIGTSDGSGSNTLTRIAPTTGVNVVDFNAGAASGQTIISGDAWVEFEASEINLTHVLSLRPSCAVPFDCPDMVPGLSEIGFAIDLASDGQVYVLENGSPLDVLGPFGPYAAGERFRIRVVDNHDGKAKISYSRIVGPCAPGTVCTEDVFLTSSGGPIYPLRVDSSFREQGGTLANVNLVRIKQ